MPRQALPVEDRSVVAAPQRVRRSAPPPDEPGWFSRPTALANPQRRLRWAMVAMMMFLVVVLLRVGELQVLRGPEYQAQGAEQRTRQVEVVAPRGDILDRHGRPLAASVDARAVYADPTMVDDPVAVAAALAPLLGVADLDLLRKVSTQGTRFVYLARQVPLDVAQRVEDAELSGIGTQPEAERLYPAGSSAGSVVGFTGVDGHGLSGVEFWQDELLSGSDGRMRIEASVDGKRIPGGSTVEVPAAPGSDITLTLDRDIQFVAQRAIADQVARHKADRGMVVVVEPDTGEILAMASAPGVDPGEPGKTPVEDRGNPALTHALEPGSVNKVVTAAAALEEGIVAPSSLVVVPPKLQIYDKTFTDAHPHGTLNLTFSGVVAKSSNIGTIKVAERLGKQRLYDYLRAFGFAARTGVGYPGETPGIVPEPDEWSGTSLGTIAIGNGVVANSLQIAQVLGTIANDGVRVQPTLVKHTQAGDGDRVVPERPEPTRIVSENTANVLTSMLEAAVSDEGTAPEAALEGYRVAGKTGTANRIVQGGTQYVSNFAGFVPADDPRLAIAVVVENPRAGYFGGTVAAPVFKRVASYALTRMQVPHSGPGVPLPRLEVR